MAERARQVPAFTADVFAARSTRYCVVVPVINEGDRIRRQLGRMEPRAGEADIVMADGGSTDGSLDPAFLRSKGVRALLTKTGPGRLGAQLRMGFSWALDEGYEGVVTVDGNDKDGVEAIPAFVRALDEGVGFAQGSRFVAGGRHANTPAVRLAAVRLIHAPFVSILARHRYTDTTNGFRAHSRALLEDPRAGVFRDVFDGYELLVHLSQTAPRLGYRVVEIPVSRVYPKGAKAPTKLTRIGGSAELLGVLLRAARGDFRVPDQ
ncbi:MAG TPA: glycosyltransferase family 2 protein [Actinomycetota bacterium]|nr:glycosyltransferase family 2 protein [Actinomycetota bacterium]